ncbi:MAG: site-2 protease family protein [Anaerolineales bacterium]
MSALPFEQSTLSDAGSLRAIVAQVMDIEATTYGGTNAARRGPALRALVDGRDYAVRFTGRLFVDSMEAYARVAEQFLPLGYTPLFRKEGQTHVVLAVNKVIQPGRSNPWVNVVMFALTVLAMLLTGGSYGYQEPDPPTTLLGWLQLMMQGWPFALSLLAILLAHEFGHYFAARYHKVAVTLPYFIPFPFGAFGTMGAFIQLKAPPTNRRALLDIGIAGPLAGFVVAVPILLYGLYTSAPLQQIPYDQFSGLEGNSILYVLAKFIVFGRWLPEPIGYGDLPAWLYMLRFYTLGFPFPNGGTDVFLNQIAWAGWAGLLVTGLNLIPAGQLDGGHALYVLLGRRARLLVPVIIVVLVALGFFWNGWWLWAALIYFLGRTHAEPLDQITELDPLRRALAISVLVLFVLVITPIPLT